MLEVAREERADEVALRIALARRLGQLGDARLLPGVERLVDDSEPAVRLAAITAVGELTSERWSAAVAPPPELVEMTTMYEVAPHACLLRRRMVR